MQRPISLESIIVARPEQLSADLPNERVVLHLDTGKYFGLNPVAAQVLTWIERPRTLVELRDLMLHHYADVEVERCTRELCEFLGRMEEAMLIEIRRPAA